MSNYPLLKDQIDPPLVRQLAGRIARVHPQFARPDFIAAVDAELHPLELKARFALIAAQLRRFLPAEYPPALEILVAVLTDEAQGFEPIDNPAFRLLSIPAFIEKYGLEHPRESLAAMAAITHCTSCEAAIRPFIVRYPQQTFRTLHRWAKDPSPHLRRLVSEGTRPRLPWAPRLRGFIADPTPTLALLEHLKDDPSLYVRRSVANHLNDISKDNPQLLLDRLEIWEAGASVDRMWLITHALRGLIKDGDPRALGILGYKPAAVQLHGLELQPARLRFGNRLQFSFELQNTSYESQRLMVDFRLHFVKANGRTIPKVFKLRKLAQRPHARTRITKSHPIRPISTRRHYPGRHRLDILVNGQQLGSAEFELVMDAD